MERVIVSLSVSGSPQMHDLDLPADLAAGQLAPQLAATLGLPPHVAYVIEVVASGHRLRPDETLAAAQIWDGEQLRLTSLAVAPAAAMVASPPPAPPPPSAAPPGQPGVTWRPLDPPTTPAAPEPSSDGYIWKLLP